MGLHQPEFAENLEVGGVYYEKGVREGSFGRENVEGGAALVLNVQKSE